MIPGADAFRGTGRTTEAMLAQPQGGVYVILGAMCYYRDLARKLGRQDLELVHWHTFSVSGGACYRGRRPSALYLDHAVFECLDDRSWQEVATAAEQVRRWIR